MPSPSGRYRFTTPAPSLAQDLGAGHELLGTAGLSTPGATGRPGQATRLLGQLGVLPATLARFRLVGEQIHFLGNYSLAIIAVSGLFVGFVLGLQGYYTLQRYGSAEALGLAGGAVAAARAGAGGHGLAVCRPRWYGFDR